MWELKGQPFEVQQKALDFADDRPGIGFLMEMGLGKSAVTYANWWSLVKKGRCDGLLIICPNTLKENWAKETEKWGIDDQVNLAIWPEMPKPGVNKPWVWITNNQAYTGGARKILDVLPAVMDKYRVMVALDESVAVKNPQSILTKTLVNNIAPRAAFRRILSGAPVVQGPQDLWGQIAFLGHMQDINFYQFRNKFCQMGGFRGKQVVGTKNEQLLNQILTNCCFRAKKKDWLDLPQKMYTTRRVEMTKQQHTLYEEMLEDFVTMINEKEITADIVLTQALKLQQISSGFIIDEKKKVNRIEGKNPKLEELKAVLEQIEGKLIVPVVFRASLDLLTEELAAYKPAVLRGKSDMRLLGKDVEGEKRRFNEDPSCRVILCQSGSAKYGHTLLGESNRSNGCSTMYFYENSYSLDDRLQMEDRNHRIGQTGESVTYIDPICSGMDARIVQALQAKSDVAAAIVDGVKELQNV